MTLNSHTEAFEENLRVLEMLHLFYIYIYIYTERERVGGGEEHLIQLRKVGQYAKNIVFVWINEIRKLLLSNNNSL